MAGKATGNHSAGELQYFPAICRAHNDPFDIHHDPRTAPFAQACPSGALDDQRDALADESNQLRTGKFKIETWDAGWWQVRSALKDRDLCTIDLAAVKMAHEALRDKLRPQLAEFGFLDEGLESATVEPARSVSTSE